MIRLLFNLSSNQQLASIGILFSFFLTCFILHYFSHKLPQDEGRNFAHDGKLSAGKPRGAGIVFILVFVLSAVLFVPLSTELLIYLILTVAAMLTGYLDDCSRSPWGELKKGILDFIIAIMVTITFINFNATTVYIPLIDKTFTFPVFVFVLLGIILVWTSINVTNCSDGVDGLSGTLTIITLFTIYSISKILSLDLHFNYLILLFIVCLLAYLWFNATPSRLMMGDAGSRAMGLFISIAILKTGSPFLYILVAFVLLVDGGIGLVKVTLLRFFKIRILKNVRTPLHDHVRKNMNWSNTQTVFKFAIIQIIISIFILGFLI